MDALPHHRRCSIRLTGNNDTCAGAYFITICIQNNEHTSRDETSWHRLRPSMDENPWRRYRDEKAPEQEGQENFPPKMLHPQLEMHPPKNEQMHFSVQHFFKRDLIRDRRFPRLIRAGLRVRSDENANVRADLRVRPHKDIRPDDKHKPHPSPKTHGDGIGMKAVRTSTGATPHFS